MSAKIFVTGSTGNVGRELVRHLLAAGREVIGARLPHENPEERDGLRYRVFDFTDESTWSPCLDGVDKVFLMRPPHISNIKRDIHPFMHFLKKRQISQVVFLSVQGAEGNKMVPHYDVERGCIEMELPYTFVRPSFFYAEPDHLPFAGNQGRTSADGSRREGKNQLHRCAGYRGGNGADVSR
jgi:uncharacterized protein YbjT (DUF2867 family)